VIGSSVTLGLMTNSRRGDEEPEEDEDDEYEYVEALRDPRNPDHDLSDWATYDVPEPEKQWYTQRWVLLIVAFFAIGGLILPFLR